MTKFIFKAYDNSVTLEGPTAIKVMEEANRQLLWNNPKYKQGTWYDISDNTFVWVEGNFFD